MAVLRRDRVGREPALQEAVHARPCRVARTGPRALKLVVAVEVPPMLLVQVGKIEVLARRLPLQPILDHVGR